MPDGNDAPLGAVWAAECARDSPCLACRPTAKTRSSKSSVSTSRIDPRRAGRNRDSHRARSTARPRNLADPPRDHRSLLRRTRARWRPRLRRVAPGRQPPVRGGPSGSSHVCIGGRGAVVRGTQRGVLAGAARGEDGSERRASSLTCASNRSSSGRSSSRPAATTA